MFHFSTVMDFSAALVNPYLACSCAEFLGCMSFGIKNIYTQERTISGWYHLLIEEVGRRKHLPVVMTAKSTSSSSQSSASSPLWGRTEDPDSTNDSSEKVPCMLEDDKDDKQSVRSEWQHLETNPEAVRVRVALHTAAIIRIC